MTLTEVKLHYYKYCLMFMGQDKRFNVNSNVIIFQYYIVNYGKKFARYFQAIFSDYVIHKGIKQAIVLPKCLFIFMLFIIITWYYICNVSFNQE